MTKGKFEMELLNSEELKEVTGGLATGMTTASVAAACSKAGDTVFKKCLLGADITIVLCATYEAVCPAVFTFCSTGDTSTCSKDFTLNPK